MDLEEEVSKMQTQTREELLTTREPALSTTPDRPDRRARWTSGWLAPLIVLLLVGAFTSGYFTGRAEGTDPMGLAPAAMVDKVDATLEASNDADADALAALFDEDAVLTVHAGRTPYEFTGPEVIARFLIGGVVERTTEVVRNGDFYAFGYRETNSSGLVVHLYNDDGLIESMWIIY